MQRVLPLALVLTNLWTPSRKKGLVNVTNTETETETACTAVLGASAMQDSHALAD